MEVSEELDLLVSSLSSIPPPPRDFRDQYATTGRGVEQYQQTKSRSGWFWKILYIGAAVLLIQAVIRMCADDDSEYLDACRINCTQTHSDFRECLNDEWMEECVQSMKKTEEIMQKYNVR